MGVPPGRGMGRVAVRRHRDSEGGYREGEGWLDVLGFERGRGRRRAGAATTKEERPTACRGSAGTARTSFAALLGSGGRRSYGIEAVWAKRWLGAKLYDQHIVCVFQDGRMSKRTGRERVSVRGAI